MTLKEQYEHCEVCEYHKILNTGDGFRFMGCYCGDYKGYPVWGNFKCPLGDKKPTREKQVDEFDFLEV